MATALAKIKLEEVKDSALPCLSDTEQYCCEDGEHMLVFTWAQDHLNSLVIKTGSPPVPQLSVAKVMEHLKLHSI